jgi:hypothetical protein
MSKIMRILILFLNGVCIFFVSRDIYNAVSSPEELTCWGVYGLCFWALVAALYYLNEFLISLKELKK